MGWPRPTWWVVPTMCSALQKHAAEWVHCMAWQGLSHQRALLATTAHSSCIVMHGHPAATLDPGRRSVEQLAMKPL
jgi:phage terminase large subunit-like protein